MKIQEHKITCNVQLIEIPCNNYAMKHQTFTCRAHTNYKNNVIYNC